MEQEKQLKMKQVVEQTKQFIEENQEVLDRLDDWESILGMTVDEMEAYEVGEIVEMVREKLGLEKRPLAIPPTKFPKEFIYPKDKVTNKFFENAIPVGTEQKIATEGIGHKQLTAVVTIKYDNLENVKISREMTAYDREVHDAVCSLLLNKNDYITPLMIYRSMTGNPKAKLALGSKQHQTINESIDKLSFTKITIDSKKEKNAKGWEMDKTIYSGNLLYTERVTGYQKGAISDEWIHILRVPVLYEYADTKNQIDRVNITLLNPPINKNEETIILQGYLLRRIRAMKSNSKLKKKILYETIFKQLDIKITSESDSSALRNKHKKIRDSVRKILDYWIDQKEIKGYKEEIGAKKSITGITILI